MEINRVYGIAQFLIQVSIAILPIGAGASGLIAQQERTVSIWASIILVWAGLFIVAASIYINLNILRTAPGDADEILKHEEQLKKAINYFITGVAILLISPIGLIGGDSARLVNVSSNEIKFSQPSLKSLKSNIVFTIKMTNDSVRIVPQEAMSECVYVTNIWNQTDEVNSILFSTWEISIEPDCNQGDYIIVFDIWSGNSYIKNETITVRIAEEEH